MVLDGRGVAWRALLVQGMACMADCGRPGCVQVIDNQASSFFSSHRYCGVTALPIVCWEKIFVALAANWNTPVLLEF